jgi:hypothetical protein
MGKRIVLRTTEQLLKPARPADDGPFEPGKERRRLQRRNGLPRRLQPDRRSRGRSDAQEGVDRRGGLRRGVTDRRRHRDRRFGLDPTLYDRLVELDL